ncbi:hypothetical protein H920_11015 [Fukomys damarensis]|uniref:Uncharacterized protein n=1 Tax=Fukomys damarensis TaxID=885580 RepID=A0A091D652_FUKDA|nr:hypothetical protein H920_11015 [Fukomys damarensis]
MTPLRGLLSDATRFSFLVIFCLDHGLWQETLRLVELWKDEVQILDWLSELQPPQANLFISPASEEKQTFVVENLGTAWANTQYYSFLSKEFKQLKLRILSESNFDEIQRQNSS